jgi:hypothetical protein
MKWIEAMRADYLSNHRNTIFSLLFIGLWIWIVNYLSFRGYGLYSDDWWYYVGDKPFNFGALLNDWTQWQGRPVGALFKKFLYVLAGSGDQIHHHYLVGYVVMVLLGITTYFVFRRRFGGLLAILLVVFWVATPTDTTRFWLTMTSGKVAMLLTMVAILAYQRGYRKLSYVLAMPTLWGFESTFFPFFLASALSKSVLSRKNFPEHLRHVLLTLVVLAVGIYIKYMMNGGNLAPRPDLDRAEIIAPIFQGLLIYSIHWFKFFFHSFSVGLGSTTVLSVCIAIMAVATLLKINSGELKTARPAAGSLELLLLCFLWFMAGLVLSGAGEQFPSVMYGTRASRIYAVASLGGGGLLVAAVWALVQWAGQRFQWANIVGFFLLFAGIQGLLTSSFQIQDEYVQVWSKQRNTALSIYSQIDDIETDDVVIFLSNHRYSLVGAGSDVAIRPWGFWMDNLDEVFRWSSKNQQVDGPRMAWSFGLGGSLRVALRDTRVTPEGVITWPKGMSNRFRPWKKPPVSKAGKVIFFIETETGAVRINFPLIVNRVPINKIESGFNRPTLRRQMNEVYKSRFFPESGMFPFEVYGKLHP